MASIKRIIKTLIGEDRIATARRALEILDLQIVRVCASMRVTSALYYIAYNPNLRREMQSVLRGRLEFARRTRDPGSTSALLRRNIHRLEKGLIMKNRRVTFGLDYLPATIEAYERVSMASSSCNSNSVELDWAHDVLARYFELSGDHETVRIARSRFERIPPRPHSGSIPQIRRNAPPLPFSFDEFYLLCLRRRSVRWFDGRTVDPALIDRAVKAAAQAPSACNRQPFKFRIFTDSALVAKIAKIPMGTKGFAEGFPAVAVIVGDLASYYHERDRHVIYIDASLAAMTFMFALETLGLGSCPINWPDVEPFEREMERSLQLSSFERPVLMIAFGYPDAEGQVPYSAKKELSHLRTFNVPTEP